MYLLCVYACMYVGYVVCLCVSVAIGSAQSHRENIESYIYPLHNWFGGKRTYATYQAVFILVPLCNLYYTFLIECDPSCHWLVKAALTEELEKDGL